MSVACPICLELYQEEDSLRSIRCGHIFHEKCISDWKARSPTCPQCKFKITNLLKVFISFGTDLNERNYEIKDKEITLLKSQVTALEKSESDMKKNCVEKDEKIAILMNEVNALKDIENKLETARLIEREKVKSQKKVIQNFKKELKTLKSDVNSKVQAELEFLMTESKNREAKTDVELKLYENKLKNAKNEKDQLKNKLKVIINNGKKNHEKMLRRLKNEKRKVLNVIEELQNMCNEIKFYKKSLKAVRNENKSLQKQLECTKMGKKIKKENQVFLAEIKFYNSINTFYSYNASVNEKYIKKKRQKKERSLKILDYFDNEIWS